MLAFRGALALTVLLPAVVACRAGGPAPSPASPDAAAAAPAPAASPAPADPAAILAARPTAGARARTTLAILRNGTPVTIRDDRELRRSPTGDFETTVRRLHSGAEAGDSEESFHGIRVGREWFTRGSGGPWVRWDDARDEPDEALRAVLSGTRDLLDLVRRCGGLPTEGARRELSLPRGPCDVSASDGAAWKAEIRSLSGRSDWSDGVPAAVSLEMKLRFTAGGNTADVDLSHEFALVDRAGDARIAVPQDVVDSRRERPVRMVESVLGGLVERWGPGASPGLARPGVKAK